MSAPMLPKAADDQPITFRMAPEYRRVSVYLLAGFAALIGCLAVLELYDLMPDDHGWVFVAIAVYGVVMLVPAVLIQRYRIRIDGEGIWRVRLTLADHAYRDFLRLEIDLPEPAKSIRLDRSRRNWRGPNPEVIAYCLEQHLPPARIEVTATSGQPRTVAEADRRLAELDRRDRELRKARWIMPLLSIAGFVLFVLVLLSGRDLTNWRWTDWCLAGVVLLLPNLMPIGFLAVGVHERKQLGVARDKLLRWRTDLVKRS